MPRHFWKRGYDAQKILSNMGRDARYFSGYMRLIPKFLHDILKMTARGKHRIEIQHTGIQGMDDKLEKGLNRLVLGMVISASLIAAALVLNASQGLMEFNITLLGPHFFHDNPAGSHGLLPGHPSRFVAGHIDLSFGEALALSYKL